MLEGDVQPFNNNISPNYVMNFPIFTMLRSKKFMHAVFSECCITFRKLLNIVESSETFKDVLATSALDTQQCPIENN